MENLRDIQAQARSLERSGQFAAALELFGRVLQEPAGDRDGGVWIRAARLQLALGDEARAASSYAEAADRYEAAGLANLALAQCEQSLRIDPSRPEMLLRLARLAAAQGYDRDALQGFTEYADHAAATGDVGAAAEALQEYLGSFPGDAAVRRRITELTGEETAASPPRETAAPAEPAPTDTLPGLIPTHVDTIADPPAAAPTESPEVAPVADDLDNDENEAGGAGRLEGFEPTHADAAYEAAPATPVEAPAELDHGRWSPDPAVDEPEPKTGPDEEDVAPEVEDEEDAGEPEPLPLLGMEPPADRAGSGEWDERTAGGDQEEPSAEELPLMSYEEETAEEPADELAGSTLPPVTAAASSPRDYIDLAELILAGAPEEVTRFQVAIGDPTGNEESDFAEILALFRKKVSESLDPKDAASHYDLGLAFKQMGLLDDAIVHLQSGLRGGANPLGTLEILGECFVLKGQTSLAARVFERATRLEGVGDSDLVGVLYGLARCQEELGQLEEARGTYERVVAVDLAFRDAAQRLQHLQSR